MSLEKITPDWKETLSDTYPILIAGPCSAESEAQMLKTAEQLDQRTVNVFRAGIWKPRTRPGSFEGVGAKGLKWLAKVKEETGLYTATEIANREHAEKALDYGVDILWIGARTTVNPFAVEEIAEALEGSSKIVLVKNPVSPDLSLWIGALERLHNKGITKLGAIHRGFSSHSKTKYRNSPTWRIPLELKRKFPRLPIICDPSHICGNREDLQFIAQNAFYLNYDGLMVESHIDPDAALSDAQQQITPQRLKEMIDDILLPNRLAGSAGYTEKLAYKRDEIDEVDKRLLELLKERIDIVREIGALKADEGKTISDTHRHQEILDKSKEYAQEYHLDKRYVQTIMETIHGHSVEVQTEIRKKRRNT